MTDLQDALQSAIDALSGGDTTPAQDFLDSFGRTPPEDAESLTKAKFWELSGNLAMAEGRAEDAIDAYRHMIRHEERGSEPLSGIGNSWGKVGEAQASLGEHHEAVESFRRGIGMMLEGESRPSFIATLNFQLAESLLAQEQYRDAAAEYRNTIALAESEPHDRSLGFLNYRLAASLEPLALFQQTFKQVQELTNQLAEMGIQNEELTTTLAGFQDPGIPYDEEAAAAYRKTLDHLKNVDDDVLRARVHRDFGKLLRQMENGDAAAKELKSALSHAENQDHTGLLASIHIEAGDAANAREAWLDAMNHFATVLELQSGWEGDALQGAAKAALGAGAHDKALEFASEAVSLVQDNPDELVGALENLASIYEALDRPDDAAAANAQADAVRGV